MLSNIRKSLEGLNTEALYEIKKLLRSRCSETMLSAVNLLECCLQDEPLGSTYPLRQFMLEEDMVGFLCDAMATNSWPLLERLTYVLELLSDSDKMLLEGHAVVAVEAAQRRAHFLALMVSSKSMECESALRAILRLMSTLLERWRSVLRPVQCASNLCPPQGLLSTLRLVLDARCSSPSTALCVANMLNALLGVVAVGGEPGDPTGLAVTIATCVRAASSTLQGLLLGDQDGCLDEEEQHSAAELACQSLCAIAARVTCVRAACEKLRDAECDDALRAMERLEAEMQQVTLEKCLPLVVETARARIESSDEEWSVVLDLNDSEERGPGQPGMTWVLLDVLKTLLEQGKDAAALADTLACQDFLWLLPALHRTERSESALALLCSMLAHLAADLLDAAAWWTAGATDLAAFLLSGAPELPDTNLEWPRVLRHWGYLPLAPLDASAGPRAAAQLLVLLHTYFRAVVGSAGDQGVQLVLADSLPAYVLSLPQQRVPACVLKMVWVSFAVNCVLATDCMAEAGRAASCRLTQLLVDADVRGTVAAAFTAHPCLLYWAFQATAVSARMQQVVLELWLSQGEDGEAVGIAAPVLEIVLTQRQAVHPLLDVVTSAPTRVAHTAARVLHQAASAQPAVAADLGAGLWGRLPLSLSRCGAGRGLQDSSADGCGLLVWLAAEVYQPPPADMALRVANLLGGVLARQQLATPRHLTAAMFILRKLLEDGRSRSDPRGHATLLSDARFAQAVLSAASDEDVQVCAAALNLLRDLEEDNALLKAPVVLAATPLAVGTLLLAVCSRDLQVASAGVLLLLEVLKPKPHPFLVLEDDGEVLRSLYFMLQNQALKVRGQPAEADAVWRALKGLLSRSPALCQQPWNHVLIKFNLRQAPLHQLGDELLAFPLHQLSDHFLSFLIAWLRQVAPAEQPPEPTPRRPMPTALTETSIEIATALVDAGPDFQKSTSGRDIADALLRVTANLPPDLMSSVQRIATK